CRHKWCRRSSCRRTHAIARRTRARRCRQGPARTRRRPHTQRECAALLLSELMRLSADANASPAALPRDLVLSGLTLDSRKVKPGFLFAALAGSRQDGAAFITDAVDRGAVAILAAFDTELPPLDPAIVVVRAT